MEPLHLQISAFLAEHGVQREDRVLVAVSGGADSCALLQALLALGQRLGVAHVHHGLRGASADADLEFVRARARALGAPFFSARVDAARRDGRSPEARARALRYGALERIRGSRGFDYLATAHTLDDQAETVLLRAIRGTHPAGLAGAAPFCADRRILRPLLGVQRRQLHAYLRERGLDWREDGSNRDLSIPRNRIRAEVLPLLEAAHPGATTKLAQLAACARREALWLAQPARAALERSLEEGDGGIWIDPAPILSLLPPLRTRALAELLSRSGLGERISTLHLERVSRFLETAARGKTLSLPAGTTLLRDRERFWLGSGPGPSFPPPFSVLLSPPALLELPERGVRLIWQRQSVPAEEGLRLPARLGGPVRVRSPLPGDRMRMAPRVQPARLTDLFARARWSRRERARAVVVEIGSRVVWVPGLARACGEEDGGKATEEPEGVPLRAWVLQCRALCRSPERC